MIVYVLEKGIRPGLNQIAGVYTTLEAAQQAGGGVWIESGGEGDGGEDAIPNEWQNDDYDYRTCGTISRWEVL